MIPGWRRAVLRLATPRPPLRYAAVTMPRPAWRAAALPLLLVLTTCATRTAGPPTPGDPLEVSNRGVLDFNLAVDDAVLRPVAEGYRAAVPEPVRRGLRNVVNNMTEPRVLVNNLLQGRFLDAGHTTMRLFLNSTVGIGGIFDIATPAGIARRSGDFGQTLHAWGLDDGAYLMLPIAGPSNVRDTFGLVGDAFLNPIGYVIPFYASAARGAVDGLDVREQNIENLDTLRSGSLDFYARLRSVWQQRRDAELGRTRDEAAPNVLDDPGGDTAPPATLPAAAAPAPRAAEPATSRRDRLSARSTPSHRVMAVRHVRPRVTRAAIRPSAAAARRPADQAPRREVSLRIPIVWTPVH
ncbi:VacJ family lipoprotein [Roseomonas sp. CCTCC AB2023176]|uniref:MlaA family lipoprotein n=1 Tax=Roseomonas sp. CCTCC AB2023176 TaxID=3342640 RepID=UPI0035E39568